MTRTGERVIHVAAALETHERPLGNVTAYRVECRCGWRSDLTSNWRRSLDSHSYREDKKEQAA